MRVCYEDLDGSLGSTVTTQRENVYLFARKCDLNEATSYYVNTVASALASGGRRLAYTSRLRDIPLSADVFMIDCKSALFLNIFRPGCRYWLWIQGIAPEEAELTKGSKFRRFYWNYFERITLPRARGVLMVSTAMQRHYARKYGFTDLPVMVMPCVNQELNARSFYAKAKYTEMRFVYAGGLHPWQCFEETLEAHRLIKRSYPSARLTILTWDRSHALEVIERRGAKDVDVDYCRPEELQDVLSQFKYGYVLRHPGPINEVATPTKVSSYMAAGVIPIMTTAIADYADRLAGVDPLILIERPDPLLVLEAVSSIEARRLKASGVVEAYRDVFAEYFGHDRYMPRMRSFFAQTGMNIDV
jgi:hypothetical protein